MVDDVKKCSVCAKYSDDLQKYFQIKNISPSCRDKNFRKVSGRIRVRKILEKNDNNWDIVLGRVKTKNGKYVKLFSNLKQIALEMHREREEKIWMRK